jgi:hypothetical protein
VPRAIERVRRRYPDLGIDINILKIEEAIDYLMLGKGDCVAMSCRLDHSGLDFMPLASGELYCIVPQGHELAGRKRVSAAEMIRYPLIGIDANDPYGRIMAAIFARNKLAYDITIRARFGTRRFRCTLNTSSKFCGRKCVRLNPPEIVPGRPRPAPAKNNIVLRLWDKWVIVLDGRNAIVCQLRGPSGPCQRETIDCVQTDQALDSHRLAQRRPR